MVPRGGTTRPGWYLKVTPFCHCQNNRSWSHHCQDTCQTCNHMGCTLSQCLCSYRIYCQICTLVSSRVHRALCPPRQTPPPNIPPHDLILTSPAPPPRHGLQVPPRQITGGEGWHADAMSGLLFRPQRQMVHLEMPGAPVNYAASPTHNISAVKSWGLSLIEWARKTRKGVVIPLPSQSDPFASPILPPPTEDNDKWTKWLRQFNI
jgi:hypothetical protein